MALTHAHLDHSGYLPALVKQGFRGTIHATAATRELCGLLLPDSGHLLEEEAEYARRKGYSRHADPHPLYTCLKRFKSHPFDAPVDLAPGIALRFIRGGLVVVARGFDSGLIGLIRVNGDCRKRRYNSLVGPPKEIVMQNVPTRKPLAWTLAAAAALAVAFAATAAEPEEHEAHHPPGEQATTGPESMMAKMNTMQEQMAKIRATTDAAERARLLDEHMQTMQTAMGQMKGGMGGCKMQDGMMNHGEMMQRMMEQMMQHQEAMKTMGKQR